MALNKKRRLFLYIPILCENFGNWSTLLITTDQVVKRGQEKWVGSGFLVLMKFEIFGLLIVGLKAECSALVRNGSNRDAVRS